MSKDKFLEELVATQFKETDLLTKHCPFCGKPHNDNYVFCSRCGAVLCDRCDDRSHSEDPVCNDCQTK